MSYTLASRFFKDHQPLFNPPILSYLPKPISRFFGYREGENREAPWWARYTTIFIGSLGAMLVNLAIVQNAPLYVNHWHFTSLAPSFAASCILIYGSIDAPLAQPRNFLFGHMVAGIIGVGMTKLFMIKKTNEKYLWISASLSLACTSIFTEYTGIVHPPSGATAVLPSLDSAVQTLGWNFLPALLIHVCVFLGVALLVNNVCRQYPKWWLFPNTAPPVIQITTSGIKCPTDIFLTDDEIIMIQGIQKRMG